MVAAKLRYNFYVASIAPVSCLQRHMACADIFLVFTLHIHLYFYCNHFPRVWRNIYTAKVFRNKLSQLKWHFKSDYIIIMIYILLNLNDPGVKLYSGVVWSYAKKGWDLHRVETDDSSERGRIRSSSNFIQSLNNRSGKFKWESNFS